MSLPAPRRRADRTRHLVPDDPRVPRRHLRDRAVLRLRSTSCSPRTWERGSASSSCSPASWASWSCSPRSGSSPPRRSTRSRAASRRGRRSRSPRTCREAKTAEVRNIQTDGKKVDVDRGVEREGRGRREPHPGAGDAERAPGHPAGVRPVPGRHRTTRCSTPTRSVGASPTRSTSSSPTRRCSPSVEFCEVVDPTTTRAVRRRAAPGRSARPDRGQNGFLVLKRDLGSLRVPPIVAWICSILLFGLGLLAAALA